MIGRSDERGTPLGAQAFQCRIHVLGLFAEPIWASGHHAASQAGHMTAIAPLVRLCSRPLAPKGPSTHAPTPQRVADAQASRRPPPAERPGAGIAGDWARRTNLAHLGLAGRPPLRRQSKAELNKGESHNALSRAVCFHRLGRLHDRTAQAQQHRASGIARVTAAITLGNTVYLSRALEAWPRSGDVIPDVLLAHLAPLGWQHINLTGDYLWNADPIFGPDGFRPLRGVLPASAQAA